MKLAYREFGSGHPLVILHGLFGQSDNWNTLAKQFSSEGFHVFTVDQRNHGLSPHSEDWSYEAMADDLMEFINDHRLSKPILLGHSMGGKTVLFFEHKYPGIAHKLIIADIAARSYEPHHQKVLEALHAVDFNVISTRKEAEAVMTTYLSDFGTRQFLLKNIYWKDGANNTMAWRFNLPVLSRKYHAIGVEVPFFKSPCASLIIRGEKSDYISNADLNDFSLRFETCVQVTIEGAGHWVHAEQPAAFYAAVINFIKA